MSNNKPSRLVFYATNPQKTLLHRLKRQTGLDDDTYRATIYSFTNGRTDSSKFMYRYEAAELISKWLDPEGLKVEDQKKQKEVVRDIFGISYSIGILNKNYISDDPYEIEMNKAKISSFLKKRGTIKKEISKQNLKELKATLKQLQTIKKKEGK